MNVEIGVARAGQTGTAKWPSFKLTVPIPTD